jgi:hypothetical protein
VPLVQIVIAFVLRSLGRVTNMAVGWATRLLFGKVPQERQIIVTGMAFASILWLVAIIGIAWPAFAAFLLAFSRLPRWIHTEWIRLAMLAGAVVIPLLLGAAALLLLEPQDRPRGALNVARAVLSGYRYTLGLAVTLLTTAFVAPVSHLRTFVRRWTMRHLPVVIHAEHYDTVVNHIERALAVAGMSVRRVPTSPLINVPTRMLIVMVGGAVANMAGRDLVTLAGPHLEVTVHPFDVVVSGPKNAVTLVQAVLVETLPFTPAYLTWTHDANELEDRIRAAWQNRGKAPSESKAAAALLALDEVQEAMRRAGVAFEEWEILFREFLLVERRLRLTAQGRPPAARVPRAG